MAIARKLADTAHKTFVTGLLGLFGFGAYTITGQVLEGTGGGSAAQSTREHPQKGFIDMLRSKVDEEYKKAHDINHRDWYDKDDDSYLKKLPKPEDYAPKRWENFKMEFVVKLQY